MINQDHRHFIAPRVAVEGWYLTDETKAGIEATLASRHMIRIRDQKISLGGIEAAINDYLDRATPEILIVETNDDQDAVLDQLDRLADNCEPGTKVILIGRINDVKFYRKITEAGVSEYIYGPAAYEDIIHSIARTYERDATSAKGKIISVIGASGGAGSSTLAQNLAWTVAETFKQQVLLIDGDVAFGSSQMAFENAKGRDIADAFSADNLDDAALSSLVVSLTDHLEILSSSAGLDKNLQYESVKIERLLDAAQQSSPLTIIDLPHEWSPWVNHALLASTDVLVVGAPDLLGLRNTKNLMNRLIRLRDNLDFPYYAINNVGMPRRAEISVADYQQAIGIAPTAVIPHEPRAFSTAMMDGKVLAQTDASPSLTKLFEELASTLTKSESPTTKGGAKASGKRSLRFSMSRPSQAASARPTSSHSGAAGSPRLVSRLAGRFLRNRRPAAK